MSHGLLLLAISCPPTVCPRRGCRRLCPSDPALSPAPVTSHSSRPSRFCYKLPFRPTCQVCGAEAFDHSASAINGHQGRGTSPRKRSKSICYMSSWPFQTRRFGRWRAFGTCMSRPRAYAEETPELRMSRRLHIGNQHKRMTGVGVCRRKENEQQRVSSSPSAAFVGSFVAPLPFF
ncbi:hypothetical protein MPH_07828 [Macrophomina phaseolina MS6]|uniref:Secreted protein n=1 Tax=Macrophomina phaseolina (strain MS6) TaxID=1126212 RepID=K2RJU9_MACPH|nr:hypothetical protein MPH_07828 [Macrophomina phaseolina MS6]